MLALGLIAAHMMGDYVLQTNWLAANKTKRLDALVIHVLLYTLAFAIVLGFHSALVEYIPWENQLAFLSLLALFHGATDCRRWASPDPWPPKPIMVDQSLHVLQIWALAVVFLDGGGR